MSCHEYQDLISGYLDDELPQDQRQRLENHLQTCNPCAETLRQLTTMKEELAMLKFKEPSDAELQRYWSGVYNRLERGIGWILFSLGSIVALSYGGVCLVEEMIRDPKISLVLKISVIALIVGIVILFVSLLRERLTLRKTDKYSREVER
jgi:predicted anti-sigma-YlaC factor YlaD